MTGRALMILESEATIYRCRFEGLTLSYGKDGGAIIVDGGKLLLNDTIFDSNSAQGSGGAICCMHGVVQMVGTNTFENNSCHSSGGAMRFDSSQLNIAQGIAYFNFNKAGIGGAISLHLTNSFFGGRVTMFKNKAVGNGGALYVNELFYELEFAIFINDNEGGAIYVSKGNVTLGGDVTITSNKAKIGGGIRADDSSLIHFTGDCSLTRNDATYGGAMSTLYSTVYILGPTQFEHNTADEDGGALFAAGTAIHILKHVEFSFNSANNGGAMYLENGASLNFIAPIFSNDHILTTSFNYAHQYGGAIYNSDNPSISQCSYRDNIMEDIYKLPDCILQFDFYFPAMISKNDSAAREGNIIFGGLMNRCKTGMYEKGESWISDGAISVYPNSLPTEREISSRPYSLHLCSMDCTCNTSEVMQVGVYRGQKFTVLLLAKMQYGIAATIISAITSSTARLETYQTSQPLPDYCAPLSYTVHSNESHEQVVLYPDGPCRDTGAARVVIDVTILPCPYGFTQSGEICACENKLHDYPVNCTIADTPYLTKTACRLEFLDGYLIC